jgi:hypothetical protein
LQPLTLLRLMRFLDPPSLKIINGDQLGWAGISLSITCEASGLPIPSMNWFRGEQYLNDGDTYKISMARSGDTVTSVLTVSMTQSCARCVHSFVMRSALNMLSPKSTCVL